MKKQSRAQLIAPYNLTATPDNTSYFNTISWDNRLSEPVVISRSTTSSSGFTELITLAADTTSFDDYTATPGVTYYYKLNYQNYSDFSNTVYAQITAITLPTSNLQNDWNSELGITLSGSEVIEWEDQASSVLLSAPTQGPELLSDQQEGKPALSFDGVTEYLSNTSYTQNQPNTVYMVLKLNGNPDDNAFQMLLGGNSGSGYNNIYIYNKQNYIYSGNVVGMAWLPYGIFLLVTVVFNGSNSIARLDNIENSGLVNAGTNNHSHISIAAYSNGNNKLKADYLRILRYNEAITLGDSKDQQILDYLYQEYKITGNYETADFQFTNTMSGETDVDAQYWRDKRKGTNLPILVVSLGVNATWTNQTLGYSYFEQKTLKRWASFGFFVVILDVNKNSSVPGQAGGEDAHMIYDVVNHVRNQYPNYVSGEKAVYLGYSGGGGLGLLSASRFPDLFSTVIDYFGMSDYGYDGANSWYFQNTSFQSYLDSSIGSPRTSFINEYWARKSKDVIGKNFLGELFVFHDTVDTNVDPDQSDQLETELIADGFANYTYEKHADLFPHEYPNNILVKTEYKWLSNALSNTKTIRSTSGTIRVAGYIKTDLFEIDLNSGAIDAVIDVTYNTETGEYDCTPVSTNTPILVSITQGNLSGSQSISSLTKITVS